MYTIKENMNKKLLLLSLSFLSLFCLISPAYSSAIEAKQSSINNCDFQETSELTIRFDLFVEKATSANEKIESIKASFDSAAKQQDIKVTNLKSLNFNLNSQRENQGSRYQLSGSIRYQIDAYEKSYILMDALKESGYRVSLNVNKYRNNC